jgi:hypothetical protein
VRTRHLVDGRTILNVERGQVVISDGVGLGGLPVVVFAEHGLQRQEIADDLRRLADELCVGAISEAKPA